MPTLENVVAVDWRSGKDQIYFFFKDTNTYSRFSISENQVPTSYPLPVSRNWGSFHTARNLHFGFTTTGVDTDSIDGDILWLFDRYDHGDYSPCVRKYDQDTETLISTLPLEKSRWHQLVPYFDKIIAGTWWQTTPGRAQLFRFLLNNGKALRLDFGYGTIIEEDINENTWPGLSAYKDRIITAAQNDRTLKDSFFYIFLTDNEYIRYNIQEDRAESGPITVDDVSWPGLLRD